ncbi:MAG: hypothetical protein JXR73_16990 [Candidatus Omnitrophica bacterium]|nr:hypothetical protein [Candidatus Omnitrophota bacterium]
MTDRANLNSSEAKRDDLDAPMIALIGFLSAILLFVLIVALQVVYYVFQENEFNAKVVSQKPAELTRVVSEQQEKLYGPYRWVNEASGVVAIPIDAAMDLIVKENQ